MAVQTTEEFKNGGATSYAITIEYLQASDIKVRIDGALQTYVASSPGSGQYTVSGTTVTLGAQAASGTGNVHIYRETDVNTPAAVFSVGSSIRASDLNAIHDMARFSAVEHRNQVITANIKDGQVTSAKIADSQIDSEHYVDGSIDRVHLAADIVDGTKIADNSIDSEHYVDGSIDVEHLADNSVDRASIVNDSVNGDKIADDSIDSEHYVDGSIDEQHIANSAVTSNKIADNAVTTSEILNGAVTRAKLEADIIDGTKLADNAVDSEHYTDGSIDRVHLEADIIDSTKLADNAVDSEHYVDGSIDRVHLEADIIDSTKLADNAVGSEHIQTNAVTDSEIATGTLDNRYFTETELTNGALDGRYFTETESDARYFNVSTGDTIKDGDTFPDNDTTIATTAAINDRIIDLVDDVGGFVPIANETSFPTANPDVNGGAGTIVSVSAASTNLVPSGTTVTIANGRGSGLAVIITGVSATIPSGFGFLVETTTTDHTYAFHRLVPKATEVTTVAGSISGVNTVAGAISNVNAVAGNASNINTVAGINANVTTVAGISSNVTSVANNESNINAVQGNATNINAVAGNNSNITAVAGNASNINSAVSNASNINSAVSNASNINTVAGSISNVNTTAGSISNVNSVASNIANVNNFADRYQIAANNPSTDGGGNALAAGDLYFNTSANELKVYNGSSWQGGVTAAGSFASTTGNTFTGDNRYNDNVKALFGTGSDLQIFHQGTYSTIQDHNSDILIGSQEVGIRPASLTEHCARFIANGAAELYYDNSKKFETSSTGTLTTGQSKVDVDTNLNTSTGYNGQNFGFLVSYDGGHNTNDEGNGICFAQQYTNPSSDASTVRTGAIIGYKSAPSGGFGGGLKFKVQQNGASTLKTVLQMDSGSSVLMPNDNSKLKIGAGQDLQIYHNGTHSFIDNSSGAGNLALYGNGTNSIVLQPKVGENSIIGNSNSSVELFFDAVKKFETASDGILASGAIRTNAATSTAASANQATFDFNSQNARLLSYHSSGSSISAFTNPNGGSLAERFRIDANGHVLIPADNKKLQIGAGQDLEIYHDGTVSHIHDDTSSVLQLTNNDIRLKTSGNETMIRCIANDAVKLMYDGSTKIETTLNGVSVTGGITADGASEFTANVKFDGATAGRDVTFLRSSTTLRFQDNTTFALGDSDDFKAFHDGSKTRFINTTGNLELQSDNYIFRDRDNGDKMVELHHDGAVDLYYDNSKKLYTASNGARINGNLYIDGVVNANIRMQSGPNTVYAGVDFYNNAGTAANSINSYAASILFITGRNATVFSDVSAEICEIVSGGIHPRTASTVASLGTSSKKWTNVYADTLYGDGSNLTGINTDLVSDTSPQLGGNLASNGNEIIMADNDKIKIGTGADLQIYHGSNVSHIAEGGTGPLRISTDEFQLMNVAQNENIIYGAQNLGVSLYFDGSHKLATYSSGIKMGAITHTLLWPTFANTSASRSWGFIGEDGAYGKFELKCSNGNDETLDEVAARFYSNGEVQLLYDNSLKFRTLSTGAQVYSGDLRFVNSSTWTGDSTKIQNYGNWFYVQGAGSGIVFRGATNDRWYIDSSGHFYPATNNSFDIGTSSYRVRNIYTNDLHLSNEGSSNDVDQTWGDWTIQEGESDLFLKNNRSGKKYKFNLTEVS